jgi:hypothetical protein
MHLFSNFGFGTTDQPVPKPYKMSGKFTFGVPTAVTVQITLFWEMTYSQVDHYRRFGGTCWLLSSLKWEEERCP